MDAWDFPTGLGMLLVSGLRLAPLTSHQREEGGGGGGLGLGPGEEARRRRLTVEVERKLFCGESLPLN